MVENPVSGITRLPVANATEFAVPPNKRVINAFVLAVAAREWVTIVGARNEWSVGRDRGGEKRGDRLLLDYFLFYNLPKLFYLLYETTVTANWEAARGNQ